jgi:Transglutaminase-like superfamily
MKTYFFIYFLFLARLLYASDGSGWSNSEPSSPETFIANAGGAVPPLGFNSLKVEAAKSPLAPILTGGNSADLIIPEIQSLADGLQNDPIKIFNHVFNHIDFQAYYGSKKGALMTMLEGKGNAFDTSSLLVSLLRASGYEASYKIGPAIFNYSTLSTCLGLTEYPLADKTDA